MAKPGKTITAKMTKICLISSKISLTKVGWSWRMNFRRQNLHLRKPGH